MSENLATVQKTYEAMAGKSRENDPSSIFESEYARKNHLDNLKPTDIQAAIAWLEKPENANVQDATIMLNFLRGKEAVKAQSQRNTAQVMTQTETAALARDVSANPSKDINALKNSLEVQMKAPLTVEKLSKLLKELPPENIDPIGRAFVVQYIIGKLRSDGYVVVIKSEGIAIGAEKSALQKNAAVLQETFESHAQARYVTRHDVEQAIIIGSGSLSQYRNTQANPDNLNTTGYLDFLMKKHGFKRNSGVTANDIISRNDIPTNEKVLLSSALSGGIPHTSLGPILANYDAMQNQVKEVFDPKTFKTSEAGKNKVTGNKTTPADSAALAKQITEDPSSLSGKPLTVIAGGLALIMGLGYKKGEGFSLWTGLQRGFMALIAVFLGAGIAKEWNIDPKKLMGEGIDAIKDGGKKAGEMVTGAVGGTGTKSETKTDKTLEVETTDTQKWFREGIMKDSSLNTRIENFSVDQKKYKKEQTGKLDDYVKFIETDLKDIPLSKVFATNHIESIFYDGPESALPSKTELGKKMLKLVLRAYLMGSNYDTLTGSGDAMGKKEQDEFLKMHDITDADIATKKLSDILPAIQKKRLGGNTTTPSTTPAITPTQTGSIAISGGEVVLRDNVKVSSPNGILAYDKDGKILSSSVNLPKDTTGKHFVPNSKVVQIESMPISVNTMELIEVSYAGERFYLPKGILSKIQ